MQLLWCDEKYPELQREVRLLWYWIARYKDNGVCEEDIGDYIDRVLDEIILKARGQL